VILSPHTSAFSLSIAKCHSLIALAIHSCSVILPFAVKPNNALTVTADADTTQLLPMREFSFCRELLSSARVFIF